MLIRLVILALLISMFTPSLNAKENLRTKRTNILIAITADHSWQHTSAQGSPFINTPNVERIAKRDYQSGRDLKV